ncbi:MAG: flagellar basal body protein [Burkholderiaceae bacterium]|nr:flagellar basal body protein [Burkholderiaceae bacterium]
MSISATANAAFQFLQLALDAASLRQQAITSNIANVKTVGYQALRVSFEDRLRSEMSSASGRDKLSDASLGRLRPEMEADPQGVIAVDQQMALLNQNDVQYQALLKVLAGKLELASLAINDGKK